MKVTINQRDLNRVLGKIKLAQEKVSRQQHTVQYEWQLSLLNKYAEVVKTAIGSVRMGGDGVPARGGYPVINFGGGGQTKYWKNLHPLTIRQQARRRYGFRGSATQAYDNYKWDFKIWNDTGETEQSIIVHRVLPFAGIPDSSRTLGKARVNEEGGTSQVASGKTVDVPARPLFSVANTLFIAFFKEQVKNPSSPLYQQILREFVDKTLRWGKGKTWE